MTEATPDPGTDTTPDDDGTAPELVTLAEASDLAGVSVGALRKRYRTGDLTRRYADDGKVLLDAAEVRRVYHVAQATDQKEPAGGMTAAETQKEPAPAAEVPEGSLLVPLSAWEKMLEQLGNLHIAGQEIAEARERAARAEERESFAQQRRQEAENRARAAEERLAALEAEPAAMRRGVSNPEPTTGGTEPEPIDRAEGRAPSSWWRRLRPGR